MLGKVNIKKLSELDNDLLKKIKSEIDNEESLEEQSVIIDDVKYNFRIFEQDNWTDDGKYQYRSNTYQIVIYNDKIKVIKQFNAFAEQSESRTGSYYSDYYYNYDDVSYYRIKETLVPEVVIPAHTKNEYVAIDFE